MKDLAPYLEKLKSGEEMERLWALAKIEEMCIGHGMPGEVFDTVLSVMKTDKSAIVRAFAMRAMYHQPCGDWPFSSEGYRVKSAFQENAFEKFPSGVHTLVARELLDADEKLNWLKTN